MAAATQYVLYSNDAVDVAFCDGAHLFLSPCGSSFCFQRAPSDCTHSSQSKLLYDEKLRFFMQLNNHSSDDSTHSLQDLPFSRDASSPPVSSDRTLSMPWTSGTDLQSDLLSARSCLILSKLW